MQIKNNIALRDVQNGQLLAAHNRVEEGRCHTTAKHSTMWLPMELVSLFNGHGAVDVCDLTEEEKDWIMAESQVEL